MAPAKDAREERVFLLVPQTRTTAYLLEHFQLTGEDRDFCAHAHGRAHTHTHTHTHTHNYRRDCSGLKLLNSVI